MYHLEYDVAVIGAGPAGLAAAAAAKKEGAGKVLLIERDENAGGILQQCIHPGFGLSYFGEELTGPEYAERFVKEATELGVEFLMDSMVLEINAKDREIICVNHVYGMTRILVRSMVLAMGCRERTRANIMIPGTRPSGIYTAGTAQRLVNRQNQMAGKRIVILGSGDIGMIMARRMTLEGAEVLAVIEIMDYLAGLTRNKVQCLDDFGIPLYLSHTITGIHGLRRIESVTFAKVDENKKPIPGTEKILECDTLLLSVGLIPENELTKKAGIEMDTRSNGPRVNQYMQTSAEGVFACGNVLHVNDLVDHVSRESILAGKYAAQYALGSLPEGTRRVQNEAGENVRYICPQTLGLTEKGEKVSLYFRVLCPKRGVVIRARDGERILTSRKAARVNPGEIEHIDFDTSLVSGKTVTVEVRKEEQI